MVNLCACCRSSNEEYDESLHFFQGADRLPTTELYIYFFAKDKKEILLIVERKKKYNVKGYRHQTRMTPRDHFTIFSKIFRQSPQ